MYYAGYIKRLVPFFATFAVGVLITGFFFGFSGPRFRARGWERHIQNERLRTENDQLREENEELRQKLGIDSEDRHTHCKRSIDLETGKETYSLMPDEAPPPPLKVPAKISTMRGK